MDLKNNTKANDETFSVIKESWDLILETVKAKKITAHAWLLAGTPIRFVGDTLLISFKSPIHRDTIMKDIHKNVIDEAISEVVTRQVKIKSISEGDSETLYIEKVDEEPKDSVQSGKGIKKVFISHSTKDIDYVGALIELLESLGLSEKQIFCTSFEPYGISLGDNFLDRIKNELQNDTLVLFVLSNNFYESAVCLCEMGATWMISNQNIPLLVPPFSFSKIAGVLPLTQGFVINQPDKLNSFKESIITGFSLKDVNLTVWERKRNKFVDEINRLVERDALEEHDKSSYSEKSGDIQSTGFDEFLGINDGYSLSDMIEHADVLRFYRQEPIKETIQQEKSYLLIEHCKHQFLSQQENPIDRKFLYGRNYGYSIHDMRSIGLAVFVDCKNEFIYGHGNQSTVTISISTLSNECVLTRNELNKFRISTDVLSKFSTVYTRRR